MNGIGLSALPHSCQLSQCTKEAACGRTDGVAAQQAAGQLAGVRQRLEQQRAVPWQPDRQAADGQDTALQPVLELRLEGCVRLRQAVVVHGSAHVL